MPDILDDLESLRTTGRVAARPPIRPYGVPELDAFAASAGRPEWYDDARPLGERAASVLQANVAADKPFENAAGQLKAIGVPEPEKLEGQFALEGARRRAAAEERPWLLAALEKVPGSGTAAKTLLEREYGAASRRIAEGRPEKRPANWLGEAFGAREVRDEDFVAQYERLQQIEKDRSLAGTVAQTVAGLPALYAEAVGGGAALRGLKILGRGKQAQVAAERATNAELGRGLANRGARALGDVAGATAAAPVFYAQDAAKNFNEALAKGRGETEALARGLGAALTYGVAQNAIVGQLLRPATAGRLGAVAKKAPLAFGEQQVVDLAAGALDLKTDYGVLGDLAKGKSGEAMKAAASQLVTFGLFAGLHGRSVKAELKPQIDLLNDLVKRGVPPQEAALELRATIPQPRAAARAWEREQVVGRKPSQPLADRPIDTWHIEELRSEAGRRGLPTGGTRAELVGRLRPPEPAPAAPPRPEPPIVQFRKDAAAIEAALSPVPEGHTRLWRGNRPGEEGKNPSFTNDLPGIALPFRKGYGGKLSYVDVPTADLAKYEETVGVAPGAEFRLPNELASRARVAGEKAEPAARPPEPVPGPVAPQRAPEARGPADEGGERWTRFEELRRRGLSIDEAARRAGSPVPPLELRSLGGGAPRPVPGLQLGLRRTDLARPVYEKPAAPESGFAGLRIGPAAPGGKNPRGESLTRHDVLDPAGKPIGQVRLQVSGRTVNIDWVGLEGLGGGEGRGKAPLGTREGLRLVRAIADAYPDALVAKYTPAAGRIKAGETKTIDLTKVRQRRETAGRAAGMAVRAADSGPPVSPQPPDPATTSGIGVPAGHKSPGQRVALPVRPARPDPRAGIGAIVRGIAQARGVRVRPDLDRAGQLEADMRRAKLSDREKLVLRARLLGEEPRTHQDIADELGLKSRERVRQIEAGALRKIGRETSVEKGDLAAERAFRAKRGDTGEGRLTEQGGEVGYGKQARRDAIENLQNKVIAEYEAAIKAGGDKRELDAKLVRDMEPAALLARLKAGRSGPAETAPTPRPEAQPAAEGAALADRLRAAQAREGLTDADVDALVAEAKGLPAGDAITLVQGLTGQRRKTAKSALKDLGEWLREGRELRLVARGGEGSVPPGEAPEPTAVQKDPFLNARVSHEAAVARIGPGRAEWVAGHLVRRTAEGFQVETPKGYKTGTAAEVSDLIRDSWRRGAAEGKGAHKALQRAAGFEEPSWFGGGRAAEVLAARKRAVPDGTRGVSLEPNTYGRVGRVEGGRLVLDDGRDTTAGDYEPIPSKYSWRTEAGVAKVEKRASVQPKLPTMAREDMLADVVRRYGGIDPESHSLKTFFSGVGEARESRGGLAVPGVFRKGGRGLDQLAQELHAAGHLKDPSPETLVEALRRNEPSRAADTSRLDEARAAEDARRRQEEADRSAAEARETDRGPAEGEPIDLSFEFGELIRPVAEPPRGPTPVNLPLPPGAAENRVGGVPGPGGPRGVSIGPIARAGPPGEFALAGERVAAERALRDLPPVLRDMARSNPEGWRQAVAEVGRNADAGRLLVERLEADPNTLRPDADVPLLLLHRVALSNAHERARDEFNAEGEATDIQGRVIRPANGAAQAALERRMDDLAAERDRLDRVTSSFGSKLGRGLAFFRQLAREDYSLSSLMGRARVAKGGKPLTPEEKETVTRVADEIKAAHESLAAAEKAEALAPTPTPVPPGVFARVTAWLGRLFGGAEPPPRPPKPHPVGGPKAAEPQRSRAWEFADRMEKAALKEIGKKIGGEITFSGFDPTVIVPLSKYVAAKVIKTGLNFADYSKGLVNRFGDAVRPHLDDIWAKAQEHVRTATDAVEGQAGSKAKEGDLTDRRVRVRKSRVAAEDVIADLKLRSQSAGRRAFEAAKDGANASRALITSFDLSALGRQGAFFTFARPLTALRALPGTFRALFSERAFDRQHEELLRRENAPLYEQSGLFIADTGNQLTRSEEAFASRLARRVPGVKASERAYASFLNRVRADVFDSMAATLAKNGRPTAAEGKAVANFVNVATGRGPLGSLERVASNLATFFFSPRYVASRFQLLLGQPFMQGSAATRKLFAAEYARAAVGVGVFYALMAAANDDMKITFDPRSADFGKVVLGRTRIDPLAGLAQVTTLLGRLGTSTAATLTGRKRLGESVPPAELTAGRFVRGKLAPVPGVAADVVTGKTLEPGKKVTLGREAGQLTVPIAFRDVAEVMEKEGMPRSVVVSVLNILGMSGRVHERQAGR